MPNQRVCGACQLPLPAETHMQWGFMEICIPCKYRFKAQRRRVQEKLREKRKVEETQCR